MSGELPTSGELPSWLGPHRPLKPMWLCAGCGDPWPCPIARLTLRAGYDSSRASLYILLSGLFAAAVRDAYTLNPYDAPAPQALFQRLVGWAEPRFLPDLPPGGAGSSTGRT